MHIGIEIILSGRVQGVGFRYFTKVKADELQVGGTVENTADGAVIIRASGIDKSIFSLLDWCKKGPQTAQVSQVEYRFIELEQSEQFEILR